MKVILINNKIYVLNDNILSITKEIESYDRKSYYFIRFKYINGTIKKAYFQNEEELNIMFDEIYTLMKEAD